MRYATDPLTLMSEHELLDMQRRAREQALELEASALKSVATALSIAQEKRLTAQTYSPLDFSINLSTCDAESRIALNELLPKDAREAWETAAHHRELEAAISEVLADREP